MIETFGNRYLIRAEGLEDTGAAMRQGYGGPMLARPVQMVDFATLPEETQKAIHEKMIPSAFVYDALKLPDGESNDTPPPSPFAIGVVVATPHVEEKADEGFNDNPIKEQGKMLAQMMAQLGKNIGNLPTLAVGDTVLFSRYDAVPLPHGDKLYLLNGNEIILKFDSTEDFAEASFNLDDLR